MRRRLRPVLLWACVLLALLNLVTGRRGGALVFAVLALVAWAVRPESQRQARVVVWGALALFAAGTTAVVVLAVRGPDGRDWVELLVLLLPVDAVLVWAAVRDLRIARTSRTPART